MNEEFQDVIERKNFVILDTETTGLHKPAEICSIAIVDWKCEMLMHTLVKPTHSIPPAASIIHKITDEMVKGEPTWDEIAPAVEMGIRDKDVIVYNATYDRKMMHWSDEAVGRPHTDYRALASWHCAMEMYAEAWGERNPIYGSYVWQKLSNALSQQGLRVSNAHSALGDCVMTYQLIMHLYRLSQAGTPWKMFEALTS